MIDNTASIVNSLAYPSSGPWQLLVVVFTPLVTTPRRNPPPLLGFSPSLFLVDDFILKVDTWHWSEESALKRFTCAQCYMPWKLTKGAILVSQGVNSIQ